MAGSGVSGFLDGPAGHYAASEFDVPYGVAFDAQGNLYVGDHGNNCIRKVAPSGYVTTFAGTGTAGFADDVDGGTGAAEFDGPGGLAVDSVGNVYVADEDNNRIRKITPAGHVSTLAGDGTAGFLDGTGGPHGTAEFRQPSRLAVDLLGYVYVTDLTNNRVRKIDPSGNVTTLAGNGVAAYADGTGGPTGTAELDGPDGVAVDGQGNVYVCDENDNHIRRITPDAGTVSTVAGNGTAGYLDEDGGAPLTAEFHGPAGLAIDSSGNLYVADTTNQRIRVLTPEGDVFTLAGNGDAGFMDGTGGPLGVAEFDGPRGLAVDAHGNLAVADASNDRIRSVASNGDVTTLAGNGTGALRNGPSAVTGNAEFDGLRDVAEDAAGNLYLADTFNNRVRKIDPSGNVTTFAGNGDAGYQDGSGGPAGTAEFDQPSGVALDGLGNVYVSDTNNNRIRVIDSQGNVSTLTGNGVAGFFDGTGGASGDTELDAPRGITLGPDGNLYVADTSNNRVRVVEPNGTTMTLAGNGTAGFANGTGAAVMFDGPAAVAFDAAGNLYVADYANNRIRLIDSGGTVSTFAGSGTQGAVDGSSATAEFYGPRGVTVDSQGNVYVGDTQNNRVRVITAGEVSTIAGNGTAGFADGTPGLDGGSEVDDPHGVYANAQGNVYVADTGNNCVREIIP